MNDLIRLIVLPPICLLVLAFTGCGVITIGTEDDSPDFVRGETTMKAPPRLRPTPDPACDIVVPRMSLNDEAEFLVTTDWEIVEVEDLGAGTPGPVGSNSEPMLDALAVSDPDAGPYRVLRSDEYGYRGYAEFMLKQFKSAPADAPTTSVRQMIDHLERCLADLQ